MTLEKILICLTFVEIQFSSVGIEANRGQSLGKHKSISGQTTALQQQLDAVQFTLYSDICYFRTKDIDTVISDVHGKHLEMLIDKLSGLLNIKVNTDW